MGKTCGRCSVYKESEFFSIDKSSKTGLQRWCKECIKSWRKENAQKIQEKQRLKYLSERHLRLEKNRKYYRNNREHIIAQKNKYMKANPEVKRRSSLKRRVDIAGNGSYLILDKEIKKLYSSPCFYCGSIDKIQADHVIPVARGGTHSIGNLVPCCYKCNPSKGNRTIMEWKLSQAGWLRHIIS